MMPACPLVSIYYILPEDLVNRGFHFVSDNSFQIFERAPQKKGMEIIVIEH